MNDDLISQIRKIISEFSREEFHHTDLASECEINGDDEEAAMHVVEADAYRRCALRLAQLLKPTLVRQ